LQVALLDNYKRLKEGAVGVEEKLAPAQVPPDQEAVVNSANLMIEMIGFLEATGIPSLSNLGERRRSILMTLVSGGDAETIAGEFRMILADLMRELDTHGQEIEQTEGLDLLNMTDPVEIISTVYQRYPEMGWLTGDVNITPESSISPDPSKKTIGEQIFPGMAKESVVEFNRTAVGILNLVWVMQGDYESFTACQKSEVKLSRESFEELRRYTLSILPEVEDFRTMIIYMVINDLGKIPQFIEKVRAKKIGSLALNTVTIGSALNAIAEFAMGKSSGLISGIASDLNKTLGAEDVDHDVVLVQGLQAAPEQSPSFLELRGKDRGTLLTGLQARFNIGQFIQGENVPASLEGLHGTDKRGLDFYLLHALYDIAGAAGQFVQNGSAVMTEPTYQGFKLANGSINELLQGKSMTEVYDLFLEQKMGPCGLDISQPQQRAVARLACMLRYSNQQEVAEMQDAFASLHPNIQAILEQELNRSGVDDGFATILYYSPAVLANTLKSFQGDKKQALILGFTTLAQVYQEARISLKKRPGNGVFTVMSKDLATLASQDPTKLQTSKFGIKKIGENAEVSIGEYATVDSAKFPQMDDLSEIPGDKIAVVGMGGGSDGCQAAILGKLLEKNGKNIPAVISVRTDKPSSQSKGGSTAEKRTVENYRREIIPGKVYEVSQDTTGSGRFLENLSAKDVPMYLVIDHLDGTLQHDIQAVIDAIGGVDTVVGVDTGGDALTSLGGQDIANATPDQDIRVLKAIEALPIENRLSCEMAIGVDSPDDGEAKMIEAGAKYFGPSDSDATTILDDYSRWGMDGSRSEEGFYGKTPFAFQLALKGKFGVQCLDLPKSSVTSASNPWRAFTNIQPATRGMFFMEAGKHLQQIEK
jgi:hypothetical protein